MKLSQVAALSICATACNAAGPGSAPVAPTFNVDSAVRIVRADPLSIRTDTRFCVVSTVDADVREIVESSGEKLSDDRIGALTRFTTFELSRELTARETAGLLAPMDGGNRVEAGGQLRTDGRDCPSDSGYIVVRQRISRGINRQGYRVSLNASQGGARYEAFIDRPAVIAVDDEMRSMLADDAVVLPGTDQPFWDVYRDSVRVSRAFLTHLFEEQVQ